MGCCSTHLEGCRIRDMRRRPNFGDGISTGAREVHAAVRSLRRAPGFATTAIVVLTVTLAANIVVFSIADAVFFKPLPFREPESLAMLRSVDTSRGTPVLAVPALVAALFGEADNAVSSLALVGGRRDLEIRGGLEQPIRAREVTENLLEMLGAAPVVGRVHRSGDAGAGEPARAVLSHAYWLRRFGSDPSVIGSLIPLDKGAIQVVGVLPKSFLLPSPGDRGFDVLLPVLAPRSATLTGADNFVAPIVRLRHDRVGGAPSELAALTAVVAAKHPEIGTTPVHILPLQEGLFETRRHTLSLVFACAAILFLLACVNVAHLFLARGADRASDMAIRLALGASRARLLAASLAEAGVVAVVGSVFALVLSRFALSLTDVLVPPDLRALVPEQLDLRAVAFSLLAILPTAAIAACLPAAWFLRLDPAKPNGRAAQAATVARRGKGAGGLLVAQVALALVLLVAGATLVHRFAALATDDLGFDDQDMVAVSVTIPPSPVESATQRFLLHRELMAQIAAHPSVAAIAATDALPMIGARPWTSLLGTRGSSGARFRVTSNFFAVAGANFVEGRSFSQEELVASSPVVVINQSAAGQFWPGESALGRRLDLPDLGARMIVGVIRDMKSRPGASPEPTLYVPLDGRDFLSMTMMVRVLPGHRLERALPQSYARRLHPEANTRVSAVSDRLDDAVSQERFAALLLGGFGAIALVVASVGVYGIQARMVARQVRGMSIRLALGSSPGALKRLVVREALVPVAAGLLIGAAVSWLLVRAAGTLLADFGPLSIPLSAAATFVLLVASAGAAYIPARRISRLDPAETLRAE
jgi:predicted permease